MSAQVPKATHRGNLPEKPTKDKTATSEMRLRKTNEAKDRHKDKSRGGVTKSQCEQITKMPE